MTRQLFYRKKHFKATNVRGRAQVTMSGFRTKEAGSREGGNGRRTMPFPSLQSLAKDQILYWLTPFTKRSSNTFWHNAAKYRNFLKENLVPHMRQELLNTIAHQPTDSWTYPCHAARGRLKCKLHHECILMYEKFERFIFLLFAFDSRYTDRIRIANL